MSSEQNNLPVNSSENQEPFIKEFLQLQQQELIIKKEELAIRREEIQANERLARASIDSKQKTDLKHGDIYTSLSKWKLGLVALFVVSVVFVIIYAMQTGKTDFAREVLKIGGAFAAGYFAGFGRGKSTVLEQQQKQSQDD